MIIYLQLSFTVLLQTNVWLTFDLLIVQVSFGDMIACDNENVGSLCAMVIVCDLLMETLHFSSLKKIYVMTTKRSVFMASEKNLTPQDLFIFWLLQIPS